MKIKEKALSFFKKEGRASDNIFVLAIAALLAVNVLLYVIVTAAGWYFYSKEDLDLSISGNTEILFKDAIEKGEKGETIEFYIKGVDEYGYIHERLESTWDIGEGAGNEAYGTYDNRGYQIYAPDGTLLTQ